jgi:PKD repeat protein
LNFTQNPNVLFMYPGFYQVCLTAYNGLGKGAADCKPNYIQVVPATNLSSTAQTVTGSTGYIFDNGGPANPYTSTASPYIQSILIQPCADSIYLTFSQFDTKCGTDFVKLFNGTTSAAPELGKCTSASYAGNGYGPGFNGGPTNVGCASYCIPNVNRPDTFKAGKTMLLTMDCYTGGAPGFSAYYWVKPSSDKKVVPSFTTASGSDSVCANQIVTYVNTTTINPADPPSFEWDLNGDIADGFECVGVCGTQGGSPVQWPYFLPGTVPVTLIAINCGGADTVVQNIVVISPPKPVAGFSANILAPTTSDIDVFTSTTVQCVDDYKWTITPSAGSVGGAAPTYVNGTTNASASPNVTFNDTGYYDVTLYVDNAAATQSNSKTVLRYIHVRNPYCTPSVAQLSSGIGIYQVVFNTINNYTQPQAAQGYYNFTETSGLSTNIAIGASYNLTVARDAKSIYSPINRDAWIDWNQDGYFTGTGENVLKDSNSTSTSYTAKVTVPTSAKIGATVLRIATNLYLYPNVPCGPNQFGEFQDYRVYVTPYNILPVITLKGVQTLQDTIVVEQGYPYTEPGYSASSYLYGDITKNVVVTSKIVGGSSSYNNLIPGTYVFSYNVSDAATPPNKAITQYRVVRITKDKTPPALIVSGPDTVYFEVSKSPYGPLSRLYPAIKSSNDLVDGNLTGSVFVDTSLVQTTVVGVYPVTYTSTDISGNKAVAKRFIDVIDTIRPVLSLNGTNPDTIEVYVPFVDPGVNITVPNGYLTKAQVSRYLHTTSNVDDSLLGTYKVTYSLTDTFGNVAKPVTRTVVVADKIAPTLALVGPSHDSVLVLNTYVDRGYTVSDNYTKTSSIKVATSGTFVTAFKNNFANKLGGGRDSIIPPYSGTPALGIDYRYTYTATDLSNNKSTVTRFVEVYDNIAPVITLNGADVVNVCRWFPYTDLGYTKSDNFSDTAHIHVFTTGSFLTNGTNLQGAYDLTFTARDQAGNTSPAVTRTIFVQASGSFGCTSGIEPGLGLDKYISVFPNPSAGIFNISANLPTEQNVRMSVVNMLGQELMVVHNGSLSNNNFRIDLSNQASGVYFLNIVTKDQTLTKRIEIAK